MHIVDWSDRDVTPGLIKPSYGGDCMVQRKLERCRVVRRLICRLYLPKHELVEWWEMMGEGVVCRFT